MIDILSLAKKEIERNGDISHRLADEIYELFLLSVKPDDRVSFYDWYSFVLKETEHGRTGNFTTTVPFVWMTEDVFALTYRILKSLPPKSRIEGIVAPRLPRVEIPGYILNCDRHMSARLLRAGLFDRILPDTDVLFNVDVPLSGWFKNSSSTLEETVYACLMEGAIRSGLFVGSASFLSDEKSYKYVPFCDECDRDMFLKLLGFDRDVFLSMLKDGKEVPPVAFYRVFLDSDKVGEYKDGTIVVHKDKYLLFPRTAVELFTEGFVSYANFLRDRFSVPDEYLDIIR